MNLISSQMNFKMFIIIINFFDIYYIVRRINIIKKVNVEKSFANHFIHSSSLHF